MFRWNGLRVIHGAFIHLSDPILDETNPPPNQNPRPQHANTSYSLQHRHPKPSFLSSRRLATRDPSLAIPISNASSQQANLAAHTIPERPPPYSANRGRR
ncbi:hypothetical protein MLD38_011168 [Melastoma candidum]|uniref:Uncharacterized protein n=1 Tax=Melastoma candidum TaxID=119954 RepID=A0ACB9R6C2_9MYRT|nr:hypothetical protein MLD38_011168 [Melastoma candidum]